MVKQVIHALRTRTARPSSSSSVATPELAGPPSVKPASPSQTVGKADLLLVDNHTKYCAKKNILPSLHNMELAVKMQMSAELTCIIDAPSMSIQMEFK